MTVAEVIAARRRHIQESAPCVGCGGSLADCKAARGTDPTAPPWFGCCARGVQASIPCQHEPDAQAALALLAEIEAGEVRTVEQVEAERAERKARAAARGMSWFEYLNQDRQWQPNGRPLVEIADMDPAWRYNASRWLEKRAAKIGARYMLAAHLWLTAVIASPLGPSESSADSLERDIEQQCFEIATNPVTWIRVTALYRALVAGLPDCSVQLEALAAHARHWSTCPARKGGDECRCDQLRADDDERKAAASGVPEWTI
ncbi:hypothetical protein C1I95_25750 [Micromonospora craterilacus]|uniref:Uncharacterized protein n=1 Tax=Micromonospora craterilacus TaxID=1655439 RepID=A0A2W2E5G9_9ACTN|nr:hypothetical protein [Micromonospora craterilacus]PZG12455.1 hypothetical protein C1I95_25750 [Micromonospora craterilacus]